MCDTYYTTLKAALRNIRAQFVGSEALESASYTVTIEATHLMCDTYYTKLHSLY